MTTHADSIKELAGGRPAARANHLTAIGGLALIAAFVVLGSSGEAGAQRLRDRRSPFEHWRVVSEPGGAQEGVDSRKYYRLVTAGGQLTIDPNVFEGLYLRPTDRRYRDVRIHIRADNGEPVPLNEAIALFIDPNNRTSYIVFKKGGKGLALGFARYDTGSESGAARPGGIYQWMFKSPPDSNVRDHRKREIRTREELALYNTQVNDYLVFHRTEKKLRWMNR